MADVLRAADAGPWSVAPADSTHRPSTRCPGGGAATFSSLFHVFRPLQRQLSRPTARGLGPVESAPPGGLRNGRDVAWRSPLPTHAVLYSGHHNKAPPSHPACFLARKRAHGRERPVSPPPPRLLPPPLPAVRTPGQEQGPSALTRRTRRLRGCPPLAVPGGGQHTPLPVFAAGHIPLLLRTVAPRLLSPPVVTPRSHPYSCHGHCYRGGGAAAAVGPPGAAPPPIWVPPPHPHPRRRSPSSSTPPTRWRSREGAARTAAYRRRRRRRSPPSPASAPPPWRGCSRRCPTPTA